MLPYISPSLLAADTMHLAEAVRAVQAAGAHSLHIDVMDGHYVANLAFSPKNVADLRGVTNLPLHVHLEVDNPLACIPLFAHADLIIVQEDTVPDLEGLCVRLREAGIQVGVAVNPDRPVERLLPWLRQIDLLLVMAVWPGFGGQSFDAGVLPKVDWAWTQRRGLDARYLIGIDGGVSAATVPAAVSAGVDCLIAGSSIFANGETDASKIGRNVRLLAQTGAEHNRII